MWNDEYDETNTDMDADFSTCVVVHYYTVIRGPIEVIHHTVCQMLTSTKLGPFRLRSN